MHVAKKKKKPKEHARKKKQGSPKKTEFFTIKKLIMIFGNDPTLVPLVQETVDEIIAIDKAFRKSNPTEFTDHNGNKWKRQ